jgi:hypothetical protein
MPLIFVIAAAAGDMEQNAAEAGFSEIDLHIDLRSSRGRHVGRSLLRYSRLESRPNSKRDSAGQPSRKQFDFGFHNHWVYCVSISFLGVGELSALGRADSVELLGEAVRSLGVAE